MPNTDSRSLVDLIEDTVDHRLWTEGDFTMGDQGRYFLTLFAEGSQTSISVCEHLKTDDPDTLHLVAVWLQDMAANALLVRSGVFGGAYRLHPDFDAVKQALADHHRAEAERLLLAILARAVELEEKILGR